MMETVPGPSYFQHHDPTEVQRMGGNKSDVDAAYRRLNKLEKLTLFDPNQIGCFSSEWIDTTMKELLAMRLPTRQRGYPNLMERLRERQFRYIFERDPRAYLVRHLFVRRRSPKHNKVPAPDWAVHAESFPSVKYQHKAMKMLSNRYDLGELLEKATSPNVMMQQYLTPIILDHARQLRCLSTLQGDVTIKVVSPGHWIMSLPRLNTTDPFIRHCLTAAVGEFVKIYPYMDPFHCTRMIVKGTSEGKLLMELGIGDNQEVPVYFRRPQNDDSPLDCKADFEASDLTAKMQISSTVDLFTALGDRFVGVTERSMPCIGVPLIKESQLRRLEEGEGFYLKLNVDQRRAVLNMVTNKRPLRVYTLFGPAGTGKTLTLVAFCLQLHLHTIEQRPCDAAVHFSVPTNSNCKKVVTQLHESGIAAENIVWLVADQYNITQNTAHLPVQPTRVKEYRFAAHHQFFVGTPAILARLCMCPDHLTMPGPLVVIIDEAPSIPLALAAGPLTQNGEPVLIALAGDPMQLDPQPLSQVSGCLFGKYSIIYPLMEFSNDYWETTNLEDICPKAWAGDRLTANYRAFPGLTSFASKLFYKDNMRPAFCKSYGENEALLQKLNTAGLAFQEISSCMLWFSSSTLVVRDPETLSLSNQGEAAFAFANVILPLVAALGAESVMLTSPYRGQATLLKTLTAGIPNLLVGTLAEMQGQERDVIIISLTRSKIGEEELCSNSVLGFLTDQKRANVLITRAKKLVIFVGCADHFSDSGDATWRQILAFSQFLHESWD